MRDHLKAFLAFLKLNRHVSPHTVRAYDSDITQYLAWVASDKDRKMSQLTPADLDLTSVQSHLADLGKAGKARSSVARKLSALRTFVRYLRREDLIEHDPTARAVAPKRDQTLPMHLSEPEIARLIEMPSTADPLGRRDRAILELFYASGLRLSELVGIDMEDVNLSGRMVRVMGKGGKERLLPFNQSALTALRAWLTDRAAIVNARGVARNPGGEARNFSPAKHAKHVKHADPLFVNYRGTRLANRKARGVGTAQQPVAGDVVIDNPLIQQAFHPRNDLQGIAARLRRRLRQQMRHAAAPAADGTAARRHGPAKLARQPVKHCRLQPLWPGRATRGGGRDKDRNFGFGAAQLFAQRTNLGQTFLNGGGEEVGQERGADPPLMRRHPECRQIFPDGAVPQLPDL